jgi:rSAM/selenodomain-associated transferase 2
MIKKFGMSSAPPIICIIPAFNAATHLVLTLAGLEELQVVVADGGSSDQTWALAEQAGCRVVASAKGRGKQLAAGASAAFQESGEWLLFLHADTVLSENWQIEVEAFTRDPGNLHRAAVFRFRLDDHGPEARRLENLVAWRSRTLALPYGDQGLLISKSFYQQLGGYRPMELMEDVDIIRRIGRARLHLFEAGAITSAAKYRHSGYLLRSARNLFCLGLFLAGVPVRWIAPIYG